ncbi:MAG: MFS transporter [Magnetococcales bacterium]|nr:MFS transporter [Magnetococcales bacterium]
MTWFDLSPKETIDEQDLEKGLRMLLFDGACTQVMGVLAGGAFLVAFALHLGASPLVIGIIAALGPLTQILQIPAILLIDRLRQRRKVVVIASLWSRMFWFPAALLPWIAPEPLQAPLLLLCLSLYYAMGTVSGLAWTSWMQDFVPSEILGRYMGRRMAIAVGVGAAISLAAGLGVDYGKRWFDEITIYAFYLAIGGLFGLAGAVFLAKTPEPRMLETPPADFMRLLREPFREKNFRQLLIFLGSWGFAVNLAAPFFTVYMLKRLDISMGWIIGFSVLSQLANMASLNLWGRLADRFSNRSVLMESGPIFILSLLIWPFTSMPDSYALTLPLLALIHVLTGISTAGVALASGNIALKLAPKGRSTSYLAVNGMISGLAATLSPILAGVLATVLDGEILSMDMQWATTAGISRWQAHALDVRGLDFLFILAFVFGLYALHRLLSVQESGSVEKGVALKAFQLEVRRAVQSVSNVAGLRVLALFPFGKLASANTITQPSRMDPAHSRESLP